MNSSVYTSQVAWKPLRPGDNHPLAALQGQGVGDTTIQVVSGPTSRFGACYFQICLADGEGRLSEEPALTGLFNRGFYPSHCWIEVAGTAGRVTFKDNGQIVRYLVDTPLERELFGHLASLIPPGGHLMVEYDSPERRTTERSLAIGMPPVVTPVGYLLFSVGCGTTVRDWYISEGWNEGPRKLQGFKALNDDHMRNRALKTAREIVQFLAETRSNSDSKLMKEGRQRARDILRAFHMAFPELTAKVPEISDYL